MNGHQEQIARVAEFGLGASSLSDIEPMAADQNSRRLHGKVENIFNAG